MAEPGSLTNEQPPMLDVAEQRADWDVCLPKPPSRQQGTIQVRLLAVGRGRPLPVPDPNQEG